MIARMWRAWAWIENAAAYQRFITDVVFAGKRRDPPPGLLGMDLLRRDGEAEVEFETVLWFESMEFIQAFAGPNVALPVLSDEDLKLLSRFDERVRHADVVVRLQP